jgi:hypothetical protein
LSAAGLKVQVKSVDAAGVAAGVVTGVVPSGSVRLGATVTLDVSRTNPATTVPAAPPDPGNGKGKGKPPRH